MCVCVCVYVCVCLCVCVCVLKAIHDTQNAQISQKQDGRKNL